MTKFRIIEKQTEGIGNTILYYIQKRAWILFIPYWKTLINTNTIVGPIKYFYDINAAKEFIKKYHEESRRVVYKE